jgi:hypothetical protein
MKSNADAVANDVLWIYNKQWKSLDKMDLSTRCFAVNNGLLWAGDSLSNNVLQIFSGFDDNDTLINNYWVGDVSQLGIEYLKKTKRLDIEGLIVRDQQIQVSISYDNADFEVIGTIDGNGSYVDSVNPTVIGTNMLGSNAIGGQSDGLNAFHYIREFRIRTEKFRTAQIKFEALATGYCTVSTQTWYDIKTYGQKQALKYRTAI